MTFEDLELTWTRQLIVGQPVSPALVQQALVHEVRQRSRRVRRILGVAGFVFVTGCLTVAVTHWTGIKPIDPLAAVFLSIALVFDLAFFVQAFRSLVRNRREQARMGESLVAALRGSLQAVRWQIRDCRLLTRVVPIALVASVGFLAVKGATGRLPLAGAAIGVGIDVVFAVAIVLTVRRYLQRELEPRREELERQLADLDAPGAA